MQIDETIVYFAGAVEGVEDILAEELIHQGYAGVKADRAGCYFLADLEGAMRANLWLRTATRVMLPLADREARDADGLYAAAAEVDWLKGLTAFKSFAVAVRGALDMVKNRDFAALKIKDAIVDRVRAQAGKRPQLDPDNPDVRVFARLDGDRVRLFLDMSGAPLDRRGWRAAMAKNGLRESLVTALLVAVGWTPGEMLTNPLAADGVFGIEAARWSLGLPPGMDRSYAFTRWPFFGSRERHTWTGLVEQARSTPFAMEPFKLVRASETSQNALRQADRNALTAGVRPMIEFRRRALRNIAAGAWGGTLILNLDHSDLPWENPAADRAWRDDLLAALREAENVRLGVLTPDDAFLEELGYRADRRLAISTPHGPRTFAVYKV